jgi:hypothetical protein
MANKSAGKVMGMDEYIKRLLACTSVLSVKMQTENPPVSARDIGCDEEMFLAVAEEAKRQGILLLQRLVQMGH